MADSDIPGLAAATAAAATDLLIVSDGTSASKKMTVGQLAAYMNAAHLRRVLDADTGGQNVNTAQPWFPATGAATVAGSTCYAFGGMFSSVRSAGNTSHTTSILFGGTATLNGIGYFVEVKEGDAATISDSDLIAIQVATAVNIKAASTSASENVVFGVWGHVWVNAAGTFIPQFVYSAAPGGVPTIEKGTYFALYPIGTTGGITLGTWV
jgi:hypothetical protein